MRRTAATALGCPLETIQAILNHASAVGITRLHARSDPLSRMRDWVWASITHHHLGGEKNADQPTRLGFERFQRAM